MNELLADPIAQSLMRRDGVTREFLADLIEAVRAGIIDRVAAPAVDDKRADTADHSPSNGT